MTPLQGSPDMTSENPNAFKHLFGAATVSRIADHFRVVGPAFDRAVFLSHACDGLDALALKARVAHIAAALRAALPEPVGEALACIRQAVPAPIEGESDVSALMYLWPLCHFVEAYAVDAPEPALLTLHGLTKRFSAEFAIRPFLIHHTEQTFAALHRWVTDSDPHVRRLVSEGTRPLLPWGQQLPALRADPSPSLPLLEALRDDPSEYVRRSVANHLNDIAKDHPSLVVDLCARWLNEAPESVARVALVTRALRTLVKDGDPGALATLGFGAVSITLSPLTLSRSEVAIGERLSFATTIRSTSYAAQRVLVDYVVWYQKKNGSLAPKVFKGGVFELRPGEARHFERTQSFRPVTTRRLYAGAHAVGLKVNGQIVERVPFVLRDAEPTER